MHHRTAEHTHGGACTICVLSGSVGQCTFCPPAGTMPALLCSALLCLESARPRLRVAYRPYTAAPADFCARTHSFSLLSVCLALWLSDPPPRTRTSKSACSSEELTHRKSCPTALACLRGIAEALCGGCPSHPATTCGLCRPSFLATAADGAKCLRVRARARQRQCWGHGPLMGEDGPRWAKKGTVPRHACRHTHARGS